GPECVYVQGFSDDAKVTKRVFQTANERLGGLIPNGLAVGSARKAQHNAEDPRLAASSARLDHRCSAAKINLGFLRRLNFDAADRRGRTYFEPSCETLGRLEGHLSGG